jgi:hypothetical protein
MEREERTSRGQNRGDWSPKLKLKKIDVPIWDFKWSIFFKTDRV